MRGRRSGRGGEEEEEEEESIAVYTREKCRLSFQQGADLLPSPLTPNTLLSPPSPPSLSLSLAYQRRRIDIVRGEG